MPELRVPHDLVPRGAARAGLGRDLRLRALAGVVARGGGASDELDEGDEAGVGQVGRYTWRSKLPYDLEFEMTTTQGRQAAPARGRGARASWPGSGAGACSSRTARAVTAVVYEWNVSTTKPWMNLLAPLARPLFAWNHDWVMRNGGEGIADAARLPAAGDRLSARAESPRI